MSLLLLFRPFGTPVVGNSLPNVFVIVPALARSVVVPLVSSVVIPTVPVDVRPWAHPSVIEGTAATAMTLETSAAPGTGLQATVAMTGTVTQ